jgi:hypothetical protein
MSLRSSAREAARWLGDEMTPAAYRATLARLGLTHEEAARLLHIHPVTSRKGNVSPTVAVLLTLIEHIGVNEARRRILGER